MGIYSENVTRYAEQGLYIIPCGDKKNPIQMGWQKYSVNPPNISEIEQWEKQFVDVDRMGLLLGPATGIVAFDFDYEFNEKTGMSEAQFKKDQRNIEKEILRILPVSPSEKIGKKGWTKFYKYNKNLLNVSVDRNNVRLFDFMAINKQTLIPPSLHSLDPNNGRQIFYRWSGTPILDCIDDIPEISQDIIDELRYVLSDSNHSDLGGRHGTLFKWIMATSEFEKDIKRFYKKAVEFDIKTHGEKAYFSDIKYFRNKDPLINAKNLVDRALKWKSSNKKYTYKLNESSLTSKISYSSFEYFFDEELNGSIREKLTGELLIKDHNKRWQPVLASINVLKSRALTFGLNESKTEIHLSNYEKLKPSELLISPKAWDGKSRMLEIFSYIKFKEKGLGPDYSWDLFKEWCTNIFRRIDNPMNQNRILIFRGDQGIGKDYFINNVIGAALDYYFIELDIKEKSQENFHAVHGKLLANIAEFDATNKMSISALKTLITSPKQRLRLPYKRSPEDLFFNCSFFSSSNFESVLRDPTGNRRFMIFDIENINHGYTKHIDLEQILAEMHHWYVQDFKASKESYNALKKLIDEETPDNPEDIALEMAYRAIKNLEDMFRLRKVDSSEKLVLYNDIKDEVVKIARDSGLSVFRVQNLIKRNKLQKSNGKLRYYTSENFNASRLDRNISN